MTCPLSLGANWASGTVWRVSGFAERGEVLRIDIAAHFCTGSDWQKLVEAMDCSSAS